MFGAHEPDDNSLALGAKASLPNLIRTVFRLLRGVAGCWTSGCGGGTSSAREAVARRTKAALERMVFRASLLIGNSTKRLRSRANFRAKYG